MSLLGNKECSQPKTLFTLNNDFKILKSQHGPLAERTKMKPSCYGYNDHKLDGSILLTYNS